MEKQSEIKPTVHNFNKPAYVIFLLTGIYFFVQKDISQAVIFWGFALVFDPFQTTIPFNSGRCISKFGWLFIYLSRFFYLW